MPITPAVVTWARKHAGFTLDEARQRHPGIELWETGDDQPTYPQLEELAQTLRKPVAVFFFPEPPKVPSLRGSFRTIPDNEFERLPRPLRTMLNRAASLQLSLAELHNHVNPAPRHILRSLSPEERGVRHLAARARSFLGVSLSAQQGWKDVKTAFGAWRTALETHGVAVFKDAFKLASVSGFCLFDLEFPVIYVNNSKPLTRQVFTLFHELGHLLFRTSGVDPADHIFTDLDPPSPEHIERLCNGFAAEFLVPQDVLDREIPLAPPTRGRVAELAKRFHVSREVILRRFRDQGLVSSEEYQAAVEEWASEWASDGSGKGDGGTWYVTHLAYLGVPYTRLVFSRLRQGHIDESAAADYLLTVPRNLDVLETHLLNRKS